MLFRYTGLIKLDALTYANYVYTDRIVQMEIRHRCLFGDFKVFYIVTSKKGELQPISKIVRCMGAMRRTNVNLVAALCLEMRSTHSSPN